MLGDLMLGNAGSFDFGQVQALKQSYGSKAQGSYACVGH